VVAHLDEEGVPTGDHERHEREGRHRTLQLVRVQQPCGIQVPLQVVDADERELVGPCQRLRERDANEERAGKAGAGGDGDPVDLADRDAGGLQYLGQRRDDPAQVCARGELGHDPACRGVERDLAGHRLGQDPAPAHHERDPGLVTG
jgi:hypothetical protein